MKKKKIVYIYMTSLYQNMANVGQTLNVCYSFGKYSNLTLLSNIISKKKLKEKLDFYGVEQNFKFIGIISFLFDKNKYIEFIFRGLFQIQVLIYLHLFSRNIDYIYTRDFSFIYFLSLIPKILHPKIDIIFEGHTIYHLTSKKVTFKQEEKAYKLVKKIIPISNGIKEDLIKIFSIKEKNITVLPDGVNLDYFNNITIDSGYLKNEFGIIKGNNKIVTYSGSLIEWKGIDTLIKGISLVEDKNIIFLIVGGKLDEINFYKKMINELGIKNKIYFTGFVNQKTVVSILKSSDFAIIPNNKMKIGEKYTSPLKIFDYMACGLPIIASNLPSMREIINDGENGIFFEPENEKDLAKKIDFLAKNEKLLKEIKNNNLKAIENYSWDNRTKKILNII